MREIDALVDAQNGRITPSMAHSYLFGRQLSMLRFNGADFCFAFNCGLNWSCDFTHAKIDSLTMDGMAIAIAGLNFCLCLLCRQQSEPLGCGDVWDCDVFLERMVRTIFC